MLIFELGRGRKFRASVGSNGYLRLEIRTPDRWELLTAPDLVTVATNALALAAIGEAPEGFKFTIDDRYVDLDPAKMNPFLARLNPYRCR